MSEHMDIRQIYDEARSRITARREEQFAECRAQRDELLEALRRLRNEVAAAWAIGEEGIREAIGNTNYAVVARRLDEATVAIAKTTGAT